MPTFCRHGRFEASCAICRGEKAKAAGESPNPPSTSGRTTAPRRSATSSGSAASAPTRTRRVVTGNLSRNADDGWRSELLPGVRSSADALVLAQELVLAEARLSTFATSPAGPWSQVTERATNPAEAFVAALVVAVASPDDAAGSAITAEAAVVELGRELPALDDTAALASAKTVAEALDAGPRGPRGHDASGAALAAPAQLAARTQGSLTAALTGEASWTPERRFARVFDRLALRGLPRAVRFDVLVALGRSGALDVTADGLHLGSDQVTDAAKRLFAVGDVALLERRAAALVEATDVRWDALELALWNIAGADATGTGAAARWSTARPATTLGLAGEVDQDLAATVAALLEG